MREYFHILGGFALEYEQNSTFCALFLGRRVKKIHKMEMNDGWADFSRLPQIVLFVSIVVNGTYHHLPLSYQNIVEFFDIRHIADIAKR